MPSQPELDERRLPKAIRPSPGLAPLCPNPQAEARVAELRAEFAERRRVIVEDVLLPADLERVAAEFPFLQYVPVANGPLERRTAAGPRLWHHHVVVETDPSSPRTPLEALVLSMTRGPIRNFVATITARSDLYDRPTATGRPGVMAHALPRGGYVDPHSDSAGEGEHQRYLGMVFHASRWDPAWGGELRFTQSPEERWLPRFGALHLFEAGMHNRHEVLLVRGPRPRYTLGCWLFERPARSHRGLRRFLGSLFESRP